MQHRTRIRMLTAAAAATAGIGALTATATAATWPPPDRPATRAVEGDLQEIAVGESGGTIVIGGERYFLDLPALSLFGDGGPEWLRGIGFVVSTTGRLPVAALVRDDTVVAVHPSLDRP